MHPMAIYTRITCLLIDPIRRQEGVIDVLVGEGMQHSDIIAQGVGSTTPVASNTTAQGRTEITCGDCDAFAVRTSMRPRKI